MKNCRTCGRAVGEWKFCKFCGTPLDVTDLSYQKTGKLLRQNVVFSENIPQQCEAETATPQNNTSGQPKKPVTTDIFSSSFEGEKTDAEPISSKRQKPRKEKSESTAPKEEPITEKVAPIPVVSGELTDTPEPQPKVIVDNEIENSTPNIENETQTVVETKESETPLNIGNLFSAASHTNFENEEEIPTEPQMQEELSESPSENYMIEPVDDAVADNVNDGFSQIDFDTLDSDDFADDPITTDAEEDPQINTTPIYNTAEPIEQREPVFEPIEPSAQEESVFEPAEPIVQEEPFSEPIEPSAQEESVFEPAEPIVQEEPFSEPIEPSAQEESVFEPAEPIVQEEPFSEPIESVAQEESVFEPVEPIVQEKPFSDPIEPSAQEESVFEPTEPTGQAKPPFESVEQAVPITKPAISVSEIDPMFGAAPSFDIESIKASFNAEKAGVKKKPKKRLFNKKINNPE